MTQPIVECIPNFSEGRRVEVIDEIQAAIQQVPQIHVLDRHSDYDHNRTVITFAGPPDRVAEAAFQAIARAAQLINLEEHEGEHPRIGATDVVPFVPIAGITIEECIDMARELGRRVGEQLEIPVYLYEKAATRTDRVNLENIRRGEYEGLKKSIERDPERAPDFGPPKLGPAGATVIGARTPLIAFNVYLTTSEVDIARRIARAVRHSSGGLRYVKALGMLVEGRAQVSMNLTDYERTPVARVVELIRREAERYGVSIHHTELVGLIPQAAIVDAAQWYLQLDEFERDQILETRLYAAMRAGEPEAGFLDRLAEGTSTPGGGSAAAHAGAMGAALVAMVGRLTLGKKKYAEVQEQMEQLVQRAEALRRHLQEAVELDAQAFEGVMQAFRMPKGTEAEKQARREAIEQATHKAAEVPLQVCRWCAQVVAMAADAAALGNRNAVSDAGSGAAMAGAGFQAAAYNVRINATSVSDRKAAQRWLEELERLEAEVAEQGKRVRATLDQALNPS